jgi:tetratricopeptide (TPR) repeat protein
MFAYPSVACSPFKMAAALLASLAKWAGCRRWVGARAALLVASLCAAVGWLGPTAASAQATTPPAAGTDWLQMVRLTADTAGPDAPAGAVRFDAVLQYQLATAQQGFLMPFFLEDGSTDAIRSGQQGVPVSAADSRASLSTTYVPHTGTKSLIVLIGLFRQDQTLVAWSATNPQSLAPLPGRAAFTEAMAARLSRDFAKAVDRLSVAISSAPDNAAYYYWRADSLLRLDQYDAAIADYSHAIELEPQDRASHVGRGAALMWSGKWQAAIDELTPIIEDGVASPDRQVAWALVARGISRAALGDSAGAVADYRAYLSAEPDAADRAQIERWIADLSAAGSPLGSAAS